MSLSRRVDENVALEDLSTRASALFSLLLGLADLRGVGAAP
ncbi:MAG TPA: hypothetical protein VLS89_14155 [Candidatus Nanopelagicales bacterium]|nr:hypothetical protein [Candidatus Nanopelagicales bacterium]